MQAKALFSSKVKNVIRLAVKVQTNFSLFLVEVSDALSEVNTDYDTSYQLPI